jgi:serine/threonine protein kinase
LNKDILSGTYGDVFRVRHRITGEIYALKQIRDEHEANGIPATAMREAAILKQLNHENIIKLEDVFLTDERCYFLLEYMDEDLKRYLDKNRPLDRQIIQVEMRN